MKTRDLDIATGGSRKTKVWKNRTVSWTSLLKKLSQETRTAETVAQFKEMSRDQQSDIKDVGGFVGGYCVNGNRSDIKHRSMVCLDADFADPGLGLWEDWQMLYSNAAAIYSTHKHTPEAPRLRLVIPLSRDVSPDEYQAIARRIAAELGIDQFDDTSYQPQRLMFWPSASKDAEYIFRSVEGDFLDPDTVLATYTDWTDVSAWPMSSRVTEITKRANSKQQDPLAKAGIIGAFCRAYTITQAIDEFIDDYVPSAEPGRYTYTKGTTAAGVVTYDDKFSYSHHATDPASGILCNAWDLVRLHKFGDLDEGIDQGTPVSALPSYKAMSEFAAEDNLVKKQIVEDKTAEAVADFNEPIEEAQDDWRTKLKITNKGAIAQTIDNFVIILNNDVKLKGCLAFNEMSHNIVAQRSLPWRKFRGAESQWVDADDAALRYYMEKQYGLSGKDKIFDAVNVVAMQNTFHPVRDYLDKAQWDGTERVETLLIDYLGAEDNEYVRAVTRKALTAAVARIYRPGCKFDYMLTLRGRQGIGKSALIAKLGGQWFSDSFTTLQGKDAYEQVQGVWLMEIGELAGMRKAEAETIKLYISKQEDRFRPAYGRRLQSFPRQCIFVGTTNETQFLKDTTGNRRFWVVDTPETPTKDLWEDLTPETVQQIWAEAVQIFKSGESLFLSKRLETMARHVQERYEEENPYTGLIVEYLDRLLPEDWEEKDIPERRNWLDEHVNGTKERLTVSTMEIWVEALGGNKDKLDRLKMKEIKDAMSKLTEWEHQGAKRIDAGPYGRQRYYERKPLW